MSEEKLSDLIPEEKLIGKIDIRAISFHGGYDKPRLSILTSDGHCYGELTEAQIALMVEDGASWLRKKIQAAKTR